MMMTNSHDRLNNHSVGCFLGAACGDCLGAGVEFASSAEIRKRYGVYPLRRYVNDSPFGFKAGEITDDTQQAILLAETIIQYPDEEDFTGDWYETFGRKLVGWAAKAQDIGGTTARGIDMFRAGRRAQDMELMGRGQTTGSNGSAMRAYPVALRYYNDINKLMEATRWASIVTHPSPLSIDPCIAENMVVRRCLLNAVEETNLSRAEVIGHARRDLVACGSCNRHTIEVCLSGEFPQKSYNQAIDAVQLAIAMFLHHDGFEDAVAHCASFGGDNDTHAAICGAISGAYYGQVHIPRKWVEEMHEAQHITSLASQLASLLVRPVDTRDRNIELQQNESEEDLNKLKGSHP
ncbi:MAG: ADP-ribosylglycohydrolase family protein [Candidatus Sumerlaeaceae bacterium]